MRSMDLRQLEYFAAVARHGHFGRAADDLYVTQSAVSQQVRRLEAELGLTLLRRTSRGAQVTAAGEELRQRAEAILAEVAATRAAMDEHAGTLRGAVRAAATTGDVVRLLPALARFHDAHAGVRIALRQAGPAAVVDLVTTGSADLAVAALPAGPPGGDELDATALAGERLVLLVAPGDPLAGAGDVRLWDVRDRPFILGEPGTALRERVLEACAAEGFGPVPQYEVAEPAAVRFLVQAGLGVSVVPVSWTALAGPEVGVAGLAGRAPRHALWLLARAAGLAPAARLLHAHLRAELG